MEGSSDDFDCEEEIVGTVNELSGMQLCKQVSKISLTTTDKRASS